MTEDKDLVLSSSLYYFLIAYLIQEHHAFNGFLLSDSDINLL